MKLEEIKSALKEISTNKWDWDRIDCCLTGKDADLEPWGNQGIEVNGISDSGESGMMLVHCVAHIGKTEAGTDVCLNLLPGQEEDEEVYAKILDEYLTNAQEVVCNDVPGEWDGDSWCFYESIPFALEIRKGETPARLAGRIISFVEDEETLPQFHNILKILQETSDLLNVLCGWIDSDGNRLPEGKPGPSSIAVHFANQDKS